MIAPETLLKMHPEDALRAQIGECLKLPLKAAHLKLMPPVSLGGTLTGVDAVIDKSRCPVELWGVEGAYTFKYHRLDLQTFTQTINKGIYATPPVESDQLLRAILEPYSIPVDTRDVVAAQYLSLGSVNLLAAEGSYRWVGEIQTSINLQTIDIESRILTRNFSLPFDADFYSANIKARLARWISMSNASSLSVAINPSMFTLGNPEVNGLLNDGDNTKIVLDFLSTPYSGQLEVYYQRRGFETKLQFPVKISGPQLTTTAQLAQALSTQMRCIITAADIEAEPFPAVNPGSTTKVAVKFNHTSLAYVGTVLVQYSRTT